ncbi:MAG: glycosyltransferase family 2 protein, partial [Bacteroidales bacterium]
DKGIYDAMNKGIDLATGEWINFMNAGDRFYENEVFDKVFSKNAFSDIDVVYGNTILEYSFGQYLKKTLPLESIMKMMIVSHQATFVRAALIKTYKFDTQFKIAADYNLLRQLYLANKKFQHIDSTISVFEAETGISATAHFTGLKEKAFILGKSHLIGWRITYVNTILRRILKYFLPKKIIALLQSWRFNKN